ncbi:MAG: hypothetical protein A3H32_07355 [Betaproteobacteria bacterium RIFCSPLOWO2_02_FULL_63_19]|nr:MAG: hypothetical protein A3H32_07355 [Betaproteobacteria bacterium RIFCSPLOWO2_02_FULL_63_19]
MRNSTRPLALRTQTAQRPVAPEAERPDPYAAGVDRQHRGDARQHLARRLVRDHVTASTPPELNRRNGNGGCTVPYRRRLGAYVAGAWAPVAHP